MNKNIISLVMSLVMLSFLSDASAQNMIKGKVLTPEAHIDHDHSDVSHQGEVEYITLPGASVIWKGTRLGTMTDIHGFFKIPVMNLGDTLQVSMIGFETVGLINT
jgi:hypothetical protein